MDMYVTAACDGKKNDQCSVQETVQHEPIHEQYTRGIDIQQATISGTRQHINLNIYTDTQ